jgi:gas vesicle protein
MADGEKFVFGLVAGTLIGAAIGLLFAPKPGKETRQVVGEKAEDWKHRAEEYFATWQEQVPEDEADEAIERVEDHPDHGTQFHG